MRKRMVKEHCGSGFCIWLWMGLSVGVLDLDRGSGA